MTTALDVITKAAKLIGVARKGEALIGDEADDGLVSLNNMLDSWSNESLIIYARVRESFTLATSSTSYLIGASQTLNTVKPIKIVEAAIRSSGIDYDLEIIDDTTYENIALKSIQASPSSYLNHDNGHPYGTIRIFPLPAVGDILRLMSEKAITNFATLATSVDLPAGWLLALTHNLAILMAPEYGQQVDPVVIRTAAQAKGAIKLAVARNRSLPFQPDEILESNIFSGIA